MLPVIGTKEFIAWLPVMLGLGPADTVVYPALAYPTYDIGARLAGATAVAADTVADAPDSARLMWVNSPSNPTGRVLSASQLRDAVAWARSRGCVLASDECYIELGWSASPTSALHPSVRGDRLDGVLAVFSLSKRSNLAGYRAGFVTGDPALMSELLLVCRQAGMIVPAPVQAAMVAALSDDAHAAAQQCALRGAAGDPGRGAGRGGVPYRPFGGGAVPVGHPPWPRLPGGLRAARHPVRHPGRPRLHVRAGRRGAHPCRVHRDRRAGRGGRRRGCGRWPASRERPAGPAGVQTNALRPVMARPTTRVLISRVPSYE